MAIHLADATAADRAEMHAIASTLEEATTQRQSQLAYITQSDELAEASAELAAALGRFRALVADVDADPSRAEDTILPEVLRLHSETLVAAARLDAIAVAERTGLTSVAR